MDQLSYSFTELFIQYSRFSIQSAHANQCHKPFADWSIFLYHLQEFGSVLYQNNYTHTHLHTYTYTRTHPHTHTYTRTHTYTHLHTHTKSHLSTSYKNEESSFFPCGYWGECVECYIRMNINIRLHLSYNEFIYLFIPSFKHWWYYAQSLLGNLYIDWLSLTC